MGLQFIIDKKDQCFFYSRFLPLLRKNYALFDASFKLIKVLQ
jgi:hypothetical protein